MGHSRGPSKVTPRDGSGSGKRGYIRKLSQSEFELEHGTADWKDSYTVNSHAQHNPSYRTSTDGGRPPFGTNNSEEHLRGVEGYDRNRGIWKSTSVVISHGEK